jgi:hypothetical protein
MPRKVIVVEVTQEIADALDVLAMRASGCAAIGDGFATHGASFTSGSLLAMLAEDASKIINDPDSWQSANLKHVFASHGYKVGER